MGMQIRTPNRRATATRHGAAEIEKGTYTRPSSPTFEQFAKEWLASRRQLRGSTESGSCFADQIAAHSAAGFPWSFRAFGLKKFDAVVSGMIEDEFAPKTIHNAIMLLRSMLAGRKGPSALRRSLAFADHTLGVKLPSLECRQVVPPTPEQVWTLINDLEATVRRVAELLEIRVSDEVIQEVCRKSSSTI